MLSDVALFVEMRKASSPGHADEAGEGLGVIPEAPGNAVQVRSGRASERRGVQDQTGPVAIMLKDGDHQVVINGNQAWHGKLA
jgi:hypothetical protein